MMKNASRITYLTEFPHEIVLEDECEISYQQEGCQADNPGIVFDQEGCSDDNPVCVTFQTPQQ